MPELAPGHEVALELGLERVLALLLTASGMVWEQVLVLELATELMTELVAERPPPLELLVAVGLGLRLALMWALELLVLLGSAPGLQQVLGLVLELPLVGTGPGARAGAGMHTAAFTGLGHKTASVSGVCVPGARDVCSPGFGARASARAVSASGAGAAARVPASSSSELGVASDAATAFGAGSSSRSFLCPGISIPPGGPNQAHCQSRHSEEVCTQRGLSEGTGSTPPARSRPGSRACTVAHLPGAEPQQGLTVADC